MIKFLMLDRYEFKRILSAKRSLRESTLWLFCTTLFFVGFGTGSLVVDLVLPFSLGLLLALLCAGSLARETWRYEWVDQSGVSVSRHPSLLNRCMVLIFRASVLFIPVAFFHYGAEIQFLWYLKILYLVFVSGWLFVILMFGAKVLWRLNFRKSARLLAPAMVVLVLPLGFLCFRHYWSERAIDYFQSDQLMGLEIFLSYLLIPVGLLAAAFTFYRVVYFIIYGGSHEKHRRCKLLKGPMDLRIVMTIILLLMPFSASGLADRLSEHAMVEDLNNLHVFAVNERLKSHESELGAGVPYGSRYSNVLGLVNLYRNVDKDSRHREHLMSLAQIWWLKEGRQKKADVTIQELENGITLNDYQELMRIQLNLDKTGKFAEFLEGQGFLKRDIITAITLH